MCQINWIKTFLCYLFRVSQNLWFRDFTFSALQKFRYGDKFMNMIKFVYNNIQSKVKINGLLSYTFILMRGVCQRCLLSVLLSNIVAEVLASFNDANKRIKRIKIGDHEINVVNFVDSNIIQENKSLVS